MRVVMRRRLLERAVCRHTHTHHHAIIWLLFFTVFYMMRKHPLLVPLYTSSHLFECDPCALLPVVESMKDMQNYREAQGENDAYYTDK